MEKFDLIVVGAGVIGCSVAFHLQQLGARSVLVLERSQIGAGTTAQSSWNWGNSKSRGDRMRATLKEIKTQLRKRMHDPIPTQGRWLRSVVQGYFAYHAVPTNTRAIGAFRYHVTDLWRRTLRRRSQKDAMTWERMTKLAAAWLPPPSNGRPYRDHRGILRAVNVQRPANSPAPSLQTPGLRAESAQTCVLRPSAGSAGSFLRPFLEASCGA